MTSDSMFDVGIQEFSARDSREGHEILSVLLYPCSTDGSPGASSVSGVESGADLGVGYSVGYNRGPYTVNAIPYAPVHEGRFPLVVVSHGKGSTGLTFRTLARYLAQHGFIVCLLDHPFNSRFNNERDGTLENLIDRPRHISEVLDALLSASESSAFDTSESAQLNVQLKSLKIPLKINQQNIFLIGHSLGAYTALAAVGGVAHTRHLLQHDPSTKIKISQEITAKKDERIKALILLAPTAGMFLDEGSLAHVSLPILIYSAEHDLYTPEFHAQIVMGRLPKQTKVIHRVVPGAGHFSFLSSFPASLKTPGFAPANDPEGFDRDRFQHEFEKQVLEFLLEKIKHSPLSSG